MIGWSENAFAWANNLAGRSFTLDAVVAAMTENPVAKAGPIIACFAYAWWKEGAKDALSRRRRILFLTILSVFFIAPAMKAVSSDGFAPRPLVRSEQVYVLEDNGELRLLPPIAYRSPTTGDPATRYEHLSKGEIDAKDLNSFPSDHAALFVTLAFGIFLASKGAGLIALAWAVLCAIGSRVVTGLHWPVDIIAGGAIGIAVLLTFVQLSRRLPAKVTHLLPVAADRWPGVAAAAIVLVLVEVANAMNTLERLAELAGSTLGLEIT